MTSVRPSGDSARDSSRPGPRVTLTPAGSRTVIWTGSFPASLRGNQIMAATASAVSASTTPLNARRRRAVHRCSLFVLADALPVVLERSRRSVRQIVQFNSSIADVPEPLPRVFLETSLEQRAQLDGYRIGQHKPVRFKVENRDQSVRDSRSSERRTTAEHFVQHGAEGPDVRALIDRVPTRLLGAHVLRRPENHSRLRPDGRHRRRLAHRRRRRHRRALPDRSPAP